jgi:hypothetical protein
VRVGLYCTGAVQYVNKNPVAVVPGNACSMDIIIIIYIIQKVPVIVPHCEVLIHAAQTAVLL